MTEENKVLLAEAKRTLDNQIEALDYSTSRKLTQARFHALDKGLLNQHPGSYQQYALRGLAAVCVVTIALVTSQYFYSDQATLDNNNKGITVESSEDTKEEIEIYNWLYEQYG